MAESSNGKQLKYFQLMEDLKEQIISGKIKAGEKLPSENELSQNYQVSRQTVRKALAILQNAGYIYAEHGRGTFCSELLRGELEYRCTAKARTALRTKIFSKVLELDAGNIEKSGLSLQLPPL